MISYDSREMLHVRLTSSLFLSKACALTCQNMKLYVKAVPMRVSRLNAGA